MAKQRKQLAVEARGRGGLGPTQRALLASALPMMMVGMPAQVRLASREPQPTPLVPPKAKG